MSELRLNLGAGGRTDPGWTHADRVVTKSNQMLLDLRDSWPFEERSADGIVVHHVLDLLTEDECWSVLLKCHRVLKLGGCLRISGADLIKGMERAIARDVHWFRQPILGDGDGVEGIDLEATVGFLITQNGARKALLTQDRMAVLLTQSGFPHVYPSAFGRTNGPSWLTDLDDREDESYYVEAIR